MDVCIYLSGLKCTENVQNHYFCGYIPTACSGSSHADPLSCWSVNRFNVLDSASVPGFRLDLCRTLKLHRPNVRFPADWTSQSWSLIKPDGNFPVNFNGFLEDNQKHTHKKNPTQFAGK